MNNNLMRGDNLFDELKQKTSCCIGHWRTNGFQLKHIWNFNVELWCVLLMSIDISSMCH